MLFFSKYNKIDVYGRLYIILITYAKVLSYLVLTYIATLYVIFVPDIRILPTIYNPSFVIIMIFFPRDLGGAIMIRYVKNCFFIFQ